MCSNPFKFIVAYVALSVVYSDFCYRSIDSDIGECIPFNFCTELHHIPKTDLFSLGNFSCEGSNETSVMVCCSVTKEKFVYAFDEIGIQPQANIIASISLKNSEDCGIQSRQNPNNTVEPVSLDEFPWLVYILRLTVDKTDDNSTEYSFACTGTLINSRYVLSSAQCIVKSGGESAKFLVGVGEPLAKNSTGDEEPDSSGDHSEFHLYDLDKILIHPSFNKFYILHDIALLKLNTSISFADHIRPVCLPLSESKVAKPRDLLSTAGYATWGTKINVTSILISNTGCKVIHQRRNISKFITRQEMCGIPLEGGDCRNQRPGNAVLFSDNERWYLNGISSWSANCNLNIPKVYTNVSSYLKWIEVNTRDAYQDEENSNRSEVDIAGTLQNPKSCGQQFPEKFNSKDGVIAPNEFPWLAYIAATGLGKEPSELVCTGSLITSRYVLSGAHCIPRSINPSRDLVAIVEKYHVQNTTNCTEFTPFYNLDCSKWYLYELNDIVIHPSYNLWTYENNIALLKLNKFVSFTDYIRPLCLPLPGFRKAQPGDTLLVASYTEFGVKTKASIRLIADEVCRVRFKEANYTVMVHKQDMCAVKSEDSAKIICDHFVNSPVMTYINNRWYLEAIHSRGIPCDAQVPDVYTRVADYLPWIQANIKDDRCTVPNGNMGECIPLDSCPELLRSFTNPKKGQETYLRKFICENSRKSDFMVCCSSAKDILTFYNEKIETKTLENNTITKLANLKKCGLQRQPNFELKDGVIPGEEFPWLAIVGSRELDVAPTENDRDKFRCTGAVINARYVVTTAYCIVVGVTSLTRFHVTIAEHSDRKCTELTPFYKSNCTKLRSFALDTSIIHPFYNRHTFKHNIALLRLTRLIPFTGYTKPICLRLSEREATDSREMVYTASHTDWIAKKKTSLEITSNSDCSMYFHGSSITEYEMCTIQSKAATGATCGHLPEGPIMSFSNNRWYLEGIHLPTFSCPNKFPAVNTRISNYFQWIQEHVIPEDCTTPHGEAGECKYLKDCPQLQYAFANPELNNDFYLRSFECPRTSYRIGHAYIVCCGISPNFTIRPVPDYKELEDKNADEFDNFQYCGLQHKDDYYSTSEYISIDEYPWSAAIYLLNTTYAKKQPSIKCTGTLISRRYVLTAAKCTKKIIDGNRLRVRLGEYNVKNATDCVEFPEIQAEDCTAAQEYTVDRIKIHDSYDSFSGLNDITLLRLEERVYFTDYVRPICLPSLHVFYAKPGDRLYSTGWGRSTRPDNRIEEETEIKKKISTILISNEECVESRQMIYDSTDGVSLGQFCTKDLRNETDFLCDVDVGGPIMTKYKNKWYVIGISSQNACKENVPQVHTNVTTFLGWIRRYIDLN